jgi:serine/threonine protein kinase
VAADGAGIRFGPYMLLRRIARGGMAEVFLARQRGFDGFDRRVAVKRILPHLVDAPDFVRMFLDEAKLAAQLTHPNIVHIYDFGKAGTDYFIAMEYVDGVHAGQLSKHGGEGDRLSPTLVARIGADAATALHHAHELRAPTGQRYGLVHRDVSPPNLMVSFDGVVKLCDFGVAKVAAVGDQLTNPGQVKGKYAYMSPEQTTGGPLDGRSDVFALGIVLWELLAGRTIVPRGDAVEAMRMIRDGRLVPIEHAAPDTPPALAGAITRALQTRRDARPNAMELAHELEAFVKSSPELATPIQLGSWLRARFQREVTDEIGSLPEGVGLVPGTQVDALAAVESPVDGLPLPSRVPAFPSVLTSETTSELVALAKARAARAARAPVFVMTPLDAGAPEPAPDAAEPSIPSASASFDNRETLIRSDAFRPRVATASPVMPLAPPAAGTSAGASPGASASAPPAASAGAPPGAPPAAPSAAPVVPTASSTMPTLREPRGVSALRGSPFAGSPAVAPPMPVTVPVPVPMPVPRRRRWLRIIVALGGLFAAAAVAVLAWPDHDEPPAISSRGPRPGAAPASTAPDAALDAAAMAKTEPTIDTAIAAPPADTTTVLEVRTRPSGARIKVHQQSRVAPSQFTLPAGRYAIDAELDGWMPERRTVDLVHGERMVQEIVFTTRLTHGRRSQHGKLTVRTTPPCEVFLGGRRLTDTPFTDLELEPASYTLVFKHPDHASVAKRVTITAGKTTRLSFALP